MKKYYNLIQLKICLFCLFFFIYIKLYIIKILCEKIDKNKIKNILSYFCFFFHINPLNFK